MALRNGTYVRSVRADRLLYFTNTNDVDMCEAMETNPHAFNIVWDQFEQVELFTAMGFDILEPGEWVEISGGKVI